MMGAFYSPGIDHVTLVSSDAARTLVFYKDLLGLYEHPDEVGYDLDKNSLLLGDSRARPGTLLRFRVAREAPRGQWGIGGLHHVAFDVTSEESLLKWKRRLTDAGVRVSGPYDRGYFTSIYFTDPDGQILELATSGPGYDIDEPGRALGQQLVLPPTRIIRGHRDEAAIARLTHPDPVLEITQEMVLDGIHHVSGITDDLDAAGTFYEQVLGLKLIKKTTNRDDPNQLHYFWASYHDGRIEPNSAYTLFGWPSSWKTARAGIGQTESVTFRAPAGDSLSRWAQHLTSHGVVMDDAAEEGRYSRLGFRVPDGMQLGIVQSGPGLAADTDADAERNETSEPFTPRS